MERKHTKMWTSEFKPQKEKLIPLRKFIGNPPTISQSHIFGVQLRWSKLPASANMRIGWTSAIQRHSSRDLPKAGFFAHPVPEPGQHEPAFETHLSGVWILGKSRKKGALKALHFSVLEWSTAYPGPQPNASDHSTPRSYSRVFIIPLLKPRKTASRKQITVGKQEYLSLTTMALSNQRGRADEPLITCAIMTSVSSIPWQAGSGWSSQGPVMFSSPQAWNWYGGPSPSWSQVSRYTPHRGCL